MSSEISDIYDEILEMIAKSCDICLDDSTAISVKLLDVSKFTDIFNDDKDIFLKRYVNDVDSFVNKLEDVCRLGYRLKMYSLVPSLKVNVLNEIDEIQYGSSPKKALS